MFDPDPGLLRALESLGVATSAQLQEALGKSQPSVSRLLAAADAHVLVLGRGRRTRYALPEPLLGLPAEQDLHWVHVDGRSEVVGRLASLAAGRIHVELDRLDALTQDLPWFLAPLRAEGYLGRATAQRLARHGLDPNPERWPLAHTLFAALETPDQPGALLLGAPRPVELPCLDADPSAVLDASAEDVQRSAPPGSSAGGEQPKLLARDVDEHPLLVKFTPPHGTPFGQRWSDLLRAEALALEVLDERGILSAQRRVVRTERRTYLLSRRFDRVGATGRRHAVALTAVHQAFVPGPRRTWTHTCAALEARRRLPRGAAEQVAFVMAFGHLIGNTDMHFGNLSVFVEREDLWRGRFTLAPVYDMLPMRWRPDPQAGTLDLEPFEPPRDASVARAVPAAREFWQRVASTVEISAPFRRLADEQATRLGR